MHAVSDVFLATVAGPHELAVEVDVLFDRAVVVEGLAVAAGFVTSDKGAGCRGSCNLTLAEPTQILTGAGDRLSPFGAELLIKRGIPGELVPLGVFRIEESEVDGVALTTSIWGIDRSIAIRDARFEDDYIVAAGTNYATAIQDLIDDGVPNLEYLFASTTHTTPALVFGAQSDRLSAALEMAASIGWELYMDGLGRCVGQPEPDLSAIDPVLTVAEGSGGVLVGVNLDLRRDKTYSRWIHSSVNAANGATYRGVATDDDPASPTYYDGPFGHVPKFFASEFYASDAQCAAGAAADRARSTGISRGVNFEMVPNPALQVGDAVVLQRAALDLDEIHLIDRLIMPLGSSGVMKCTSRARQDLAA
jgi:hypothetical protein